MEIIKIGSDSFKISLSAPEAEKYEINKSSSTDEKISIGIRTLLDAVKKSEGIDFGVDKIATEIFISRDGCCDIFVSKAQKKSDIIKLKKDALQRSIYSFDCLENLLVICKRLCHMEYRNEALIYRDFEKGSYYLILCGIYPKDIKYAFIAEYGERVKNNLVSYIEEYCERICEKNPLEILSKLL